MFVFVVFAILYTIYLFCVRDKRMEYEIERFLGPPAYPIVGNIFNYFSTDFQEIKRREIEAFRKYGDTFRVKVPHGYIVSTVDAKIGEAILSSTTHYLEKANDYKMFNLVAGNGLVTSSGHLWRSHRKAIQPAFSVGMLKQFINVFDEKAQILVEILKRHCDGNVLNIDEFVGRCSGDILLETSMGLKTNIQIDMDSQYMLTNSTLTRLCFNKVTSYWKRFDILYSIFGYAEKQQLMQNIAESKRQATQVIENRRRFLCANGARNTDAGKCFVDILLESTIDGQTMNNQEILDEIQTVLIAGQDPSSHTISSTLFLLSRHKSIQDRLFAEIDEVVGRDGHAAITYHQLLDLKFMEMVIKESMRLYPAVQMIARKIDHDLKLDDGRIIPTGVDIRLYLGMMMRNPKYFKNPNIFNPNRFSTDEMNRYVYAPFSTGKRDCIAKKFAMFSIKMVVCRILQCFEVVEMGDDPITQNEVITRSINGFQMAIKMRTR